MKAIIILHERVNENQLPAGADIFPTQGGFVIRLGQPPGCVKEELFMTSTSGKVSQTITFHQCEISCFVLKHDNIILYQCMINWMNLWLLWETVVSTWSFLLCSDYVFFFFPFASPAQVHLWKMKAWRGRSEPFHSPKAPPISSTRCPQHPRGKSSFLERLKDCFYSQCQLNIAHVDRWLSHLSMKGLMSLSICSQNQSAHVTQYDWYCNKWQTRANF